MLYIKLKKRLKAFPISLKSCPKSTSSEVLGVFEFVLIVYELKICCKICLVIKYVGLTPLEPRPPEANVPPVSRGLSLA